MIKSDYAMENTSERMKRLGIGNAKIIRMDAEDMEFGDEAFDYL